MIRRREDRLERRDDHEAITGAIVALGIVVAFVGVGVLFYALLSAAFPLPTSSAANCFPSKAEFDDLLEDDFSRRYR